MEYPGYNQPHGLNQNIAIATPNRNQPGNFTVRHLFAISPAPRKPMGLPHLQRVPLEFQAQGRD